MQASLKDKMVKTGILTWSTNSFKKCHKQMSRTLPQVTNIGWFEYAFNSQVKISENFRGEAPNEQKHPPVKKLQNAVGVKFLSYFWEQLWCILIQISPLQLSIIHDGARESIACEHRRISACRFPPIARFPSRFVITCLYLNSQVHRSPKCDTHGHFCLTFGNIAILTNSSTLISKIIVAKLNS